MENLVSSHLPTTLHRSLDIYDTYHGTMVHIYTYIHRFLKIV